MVTNIKITTDSGRQVDYLNAEDLSIRMNRIADDLQDVETRYGEFSFSFNLAKTRNNCEIFGFANVPAVRDKFRINPVDVKVFNNDLLVLDGQLELQEISDDGFKCLFFSKLTQLTDLLKDKNMQMIKTCPKIPWDYETTIRAHILTGGTSSDDSPFKFPLVYYTTFFCPSSVFTGKTDSVTDQNGTTNHLFQRQRDQQNWYYLINHTTLGENAMYHHQMPLAFHLKSMMEYMFKDVGWSIGGSFWEDDDIKRLIVPYVGDTDVYDRAVFCFPSGFVSGSTCCSGYTYTPDVRPVGANGAVIMLDTGKFMPDVDCMDFFEDIVKLFNLYLMIDTDNRRILFETYNVMFTNKTAPYDIDGKILGGIVTSRVDDYDPSISFDDIDNKAILGDNRYMASSGTSAYTTRYQVTATSSLFDQVFNYIGTTTGSIKLGLGAPAVKRMRIRNEYNYSDVLKTAADHVMFLPFISKQELNDNNNKFFSKKDGDSTAYNDESTIQYNGKPTLYYYYGVSLSDFQQKTVAIGAQSNYFFFNFDNVNQKIPFASPFALKTYRKNIDMVLTNAASDSGSTSDPLVMNASYMQSIWLMMSTSTGVSDQRGFSLVLADVNDFGDTIYTKFHRGKYQRYRHSEVLTADITCTDYDWRVMQINKPVMYDNQIYSIMSIKNYDIAKSTATIQLIRQL